MITRRSFLGTTGFAFLGLQRYTLAEPSARVVEPFGPLLKDPQGILDLPQGFSYRVLARKGERMDDGYKVPGMADGMAAFPGPEGKVVLVCNHELGLEMTAMGPFENNTRLPDGFDAALSFDPGDDRKNPSLGGTSNLVFDPATGKKTAHFLSLTGTDRNCAGGPMPWGAWITCEEPADLTVDRGQRHGWCFEVKATAEPGLHGISSHARRGRNRVNRQHVEIRDIRQQVERHDDGRPHQQAERHVALCIAHFAANHRHQLPALIGPQRGDQSHAETR